MKLPLAALSLVGALAFAPTSCSDPGASAPVQPKNSEPASPKGGQVAEPRAFVDAPLSEANARLLDLAFGAVSRLPDVPHRKNRTRLQAMLVHACLELDQPVRARQWADQIAGWERGLCYAELADHCVQHHIEADVSGFLATATRIADESMAEEGSQEWRRDRIRAKVAAVHLLLGQADAARELQTGLIDSEIGHLAAAKAKLLDPAAFDQQLARLDEVLASENIDQAIGALKMCVELFARFPGDAAKRELLVERVTKAFPKLPLQMRLESVLEIADAAVACGDRPTAMALFDHAGKLVEDKGWVLEDQVGLRAKVALHRARGGDAEGAKKALDAVSDWYQEHRDQIVDVFRGDALRPIAEGYMACGAAEEAARAYRLIVEEGVHNPNSKPRAEDLAKTCVSMARSGFVPEESLAVRMKSIAEALGEPW